MSTHDDPYRARPPAPRLYGDVPTFLGLPRWRPDEAWAAVVLGVPWEGALTWGSYGGCEWAPRAVRKVSLRYGSYVPEFDVDFLDHVRVADAGDLALDPGDPEASRQRIRERARALRAAGAVPVALGGDHSITFPLLQGVAEATGGRVGVIVFDAHFDAVPEYQGDRYARCCPFARALELPQVRGRNLVQIGIRGPRNSREGARLLRAAGATVFTARHVRELGIREVVDRALEIALDGTDALYVSVDSDVLDMGFNPGGPPDPGGISPAELLEALVRVGEAGLAALDVVEVYPLQEGGERSCHVAAWCVIYALAGLARGRRRAARAHAAVGPAGGAGGA